MTATPRRIAALGGFDTLGDYLVAEGSRDLGEAVAIAEVIVGRTVEPKRSRGCLQSHLLERISGSYQVAVRAGSSPNQPPSRSAVIAVPGCTAG